MIPPLLYSFAEILPELVARSGTPFAKEAGAALQNVVDRLPAPPTPPPPSSSSSAEKGSAEAALSGLAGVLTNVGNVAAALPLPPLPPGFPPPPFSSSSSSSSSSAAAAGAAEQTFPSASSSPAAAGAAAAAEAEAGGPDPATLEGGVHGSSSAFPDTASSPAAAGAAAAAARARGSLLHGLLTGEPPAADRVLSGAREELLGAAAPGIGGRRSAGVARTRTGRRRAAEVLAGRSRSGEEAVERAAGERCGAALCHGGPSERGIFPTPTADRFPRFCR